MTFQSDPLLCIHNNLGLREHLNSLFWFMLWQSKETIDAAVGDVLAKPWLPLPLGLKPPSMESVLGELQRQGISKVPPSCA